MLAIKKNTRRMLAIMVETAFNHGSDVTTPYDALQTNYDYDKKRIVENDKRIRYRNIKII